MYHQLFSHEHEMSERTNLSKQSQKNKRKQFFNPENVLLKAFIHAKVEMFSSHVIFTEFHVFFFVSLHIKPNHHPNKRCILIGRKKSLYFFCLLRFPIFTNRNREKEIKRLFFGYFVQ